MSEASAMPDDTVDLDSDSEEDQESSTMAAAGRRPGPIEVPVVGFVTEVQDREADTYRSAQSHEPDTYRSSHTALSSGVTSPAARPPAQIVWSEELGEYVDASGQPSRATTPGGHTHRPAPEEDDAPPRTPAQIGQSLDFFLTQQEQLRDELERYPSDSHLMLICQLCDSHLAGTWRSSSPKRTKRGSL